MSHSNSQFGLQECWYVVYNSPWYKDGVFHPKFIYGPFYNKDRVLKHARYSGRSISDYIIHVIPKVKPPKDEPIWR